MKIIITIAIEGYFQKHDVNSWPEAQQIINDILSTNQRKNIVIDIVVNRPHNSMVE